MLQDENTLRALTTSNPDSTSSHSPSSSPTPYEHEYELRIPEHPATITIDLDPITPIIETHTVTTEVEPDLIPIPNLREMGFTFLNDLPGYFNDLWPYILQAADRSEAHEFYLIIAGIAIGILLWSYFKLFMPNRLFDKISKNIITKFK
jgi:hypothetical protein